MPFVADASISLAWFFADEATTYSRSVRDQLRRTSIVVPAIWPLEMFNVLLSSERRGRITNLQASRIGALLARLPIEIESTDLAALSGLTCHIAREHGRSIYDASYLELARRRGLSLATLDGQMQTAAWQLGISLVAVAADANSI